MGMDCPFCSPAAVDVEMSNEVGYRRRDRYPVSPGHMLVIPYRHVESYFDCSEEERRGLWDLVDEAKAALDRDLSPDGYNIGINVGAAAGQTVMHLHIHVIPRYRGDMEDPRGGVRGAIPEKRRY